MKVSSTRQAVILASVMTCFIYLTYRVVFTFNLTSPLAWVASFGLFAAELYTGTLMLLYLLQVWHPSEPPEQPVLPDRTVDVFVPTYNEDVSILRTTLRACVAMEYPHRTYVLDDGRRAEVEELAKELGVGYITRADNKHAKAGNMNNALRQTDGEFIAILDADHVPEPNFIIRLLGYFKDEMLAYVQTPHAFYNFDSFQARYSARKNTYWDEGLLFYNVIQPGRNHWNAAIFAGSAALFRRSALEDIGGFAVETITEDLHTGLRLHAHGWKSIAVSERLIAGQAAPDVTTFHSQRLRWGEGNLSILAYDNPLWMRGLTLAQRLCYLGSMIHWAGGPFLLLIYLTPLVMLFTGVPPVNAFRWEFVALMAVYMALNYISFRLSSGNVGLFWNAQMFAMTNFWTSTQSVFRALFRRRFQKFVVTSKRGRQSKRVLPFIWPQAALLLLSVLALAWGWYLPISGISDDYYKPILASLWALFHMVVSVAVIYRSLWPESRRFAYRHAVSLPVAYDKDGAASYGMTVDLSDTGVGMLAFNRVEPGDRLRVALRGAGTEVECDAEVAWSFKIDSRLRAGTQSFRAWRCGLRFLDVEPAQTDALNQLCWHYAVPLRYHEFARGGGNPPRRLPVFVQSTAAACYAVTDDVTPKGFTARLDEFIPAGTAVSFVMLTAGEEVRGTAKVVEGQVETLADRPYQLARLRFTSLEGHGQEVVNVLARPGSRQRLQPLLSPFSPGRPVPVRRALVAAAVILTLLLPVELLTFHRVFRDDAFLLASSTAPSPLPDSERTRLLAIYETVQGQRYPTNDRLVLLENALLHHRMLNEARQVTLILAKRDTSNFNLQLAFVQALDDTGESRVALHGYLALLKRMDTGNYPAERRGEVELAAARAAVHGDELDASIPLFQAVLRHPTFDTDAVRNELGGVLLRTGRVKETIDLYSDHAPDLDGLMLLARAHLQSGNFAAAEADAKKLLASRPNDLPSELLLLRALVLQSKFAEAGSLINDLFGEHPDNVSVRTEMGQLALVHKSYDKALLLFQGLLEGAKPLGEDRAKVFQGYVDAAAAAEDISLIKPEVLEQVEKVMAESPFTPIDYLGRLAWVLERTHEPGRAATLLHRLLKAQPQSVDYRQRYVNDLQAAGRWKEAEAYLKSLPPSPETRQMLVELYLVQKEYPAAEKICKDILRNNPFSVRGTLLLAEVMLAQENRSEARRLLDEARRAQEISPANRTLLANVMLWAGDSEGALTEYRSQLERDFDQPTLWSGYVSAASAAPTLLPGDDDLVRRIGEKVISTSHDALLLARLGWVLHRQKHPTESRQALARARALRPRSPVARKEMAGILGAVGMYSAAIALYRGLPLDAADRRNLAGLHEAANDFPAAVTQYRAILREKPGDLSARERLAQVLAWEKDYPAAIAEVERLIRAEPKKVAWKVQLAALQVESGDAVAALATYTNLLESEPDQPELWAGFVNAAGTASTLPRQSADVAKEVGKLVAETPPTDARFLSRLAWVLVRAGDSARARVLVGRAAALEPNDPAVRKEVAGVLGAIGQYRRAIQMLKGLDLDFEDRLKLVQLYNGDRDFAAAEAECRKLEVLKPDDVRVDLLLADVLAWRGKYEAASALLRRMQRTDPDSEAVALRLARVDLWGRNYPAALKQYAGLLEKDRKQKEAWEGFLQAAAGSSGPLEDRYRKLLQELSESTLADPPSDPLYLGRLADAMRRVKEPKKAIELLQRAVALDPESRPLQLQLAEALYADGRYEDAERYFRAVLKEGGGN